ncbi:MOS1T transposase, partial [Acromyrmex charruanus]
QLLCLHVFWLVFDFCLFQKMDQRICIKFCVKNKIKCADAFRMLTVAYGEATLDRSNIYRWYKMFSKGREDVNDEERAGRPSTSTTDENIDEVKKIVLANRRITVREVAEDLNISIGSCHSIFTNDLGMHTSLLVREFLAKNNTLMMPQPPYSPDLAPCDFFLFPKLKRPMKGQRYATIEEIKTASKEELNKITKNDFLKCFEDWKKRWHKCIISDGDYFEGDKIHIHEINNF